MQKLLVWVSIILAVVVGGKCVYESLDTGAYEYAASTRVQGWLDGIKSGGDFQKGSNMCEHAPDLPIRHAHTDPSRDATTASASQPPLQLLRVSTRRRRVVPRPR